MTYLLNCRKYDLKENCKPEKKKQNTGLKYDKNRKTNVGFRKLVSNCNIGFNKYNH